MTKNFELKPLLACLSFCLLGQFVACSKYGKRSSPAVEKAACQQVVDINEKYSDLIESPPERSDEEVMDDQNPYPVEQITRAKQRLAEREAVLAKFPDTFSCMVNVNKEDDEIREYSREDIESEVRADVEILRSEIAVP